MFLLCHSKYRIVPKPVVPSTFVPTGCEQGKKTKTFKSKKAIMRVKIRVLEYVDLIIPANWPKYQPF